jgi:hypothetical protein
MLSCGLHPCPQHCHQLFDHSKMACERVVEFKCSKNHMQRCKCHQSQLSTCYECKLDDERRQKQRELDLELQNKRDQAQTSHVVEMAALDRQIQKVREEEAEKRTAIKRTQALEQKRRDLKVAQLRVETPRPIDTAENVTLCALDNKASLASTATKKAEVLKPNRTDDRESVDCQIITDACSKSEAEWERQKRVDGASNEAIDSLMGLTGLEDVKSKILSIKAKIETAGRQGSDMKKERLGMLMLGNPGTGKGSPPRVFMSI